MKLMDWLEDVDAPLATLRPGNDPVEFTLTGKAYANGGISVHESEPITISVGDGQTAGAKVEQGEFHIPRGKGLLPGNYRVEIKAMRAVGKKYLDRGSGQEEQDREQFIPARYNSHTQLTREITADGKNRLEFELTGNKD